MDILSLANDALISYIKGKVANLGLRHVIETTGILIFLMTTVFFILNCSFVAL